MSREIPISRPALRYAAEVLVHELRVRNKTVADPTAIARLVLEAYLPLALQEKNRTHPRISETTWLIAGMDEGASLTLEPTAITGVRGRFPAARRLMGNPAASWQCKALASGEIRVVRIKDGVPASAGRAVYARQTLEIARMKPGETKMAETIKRVRGAGQLCQHHRAGARRILEDWRATWTVRTTPAGVEVTRTR